MGANAAKVLGEISTSTFESHSKLYDLLFDEMLHVFRWLPFGPYNFRQK